MFTPAYLQRLISTSKNELKAMAPRHRDRELERGPNIKTVARLALAGSWPKRHRLHKKESSICAPAFGSPQTGPKKSTTHSKFRSLRRNKLANLCNFSTHSAAKADEVDTEKPQLETNSSSPTMSLQRRDTDSTATTMQPSVSSPPTTRASSSGLKPKPVSKCLIPRGEYAMSNTPSIPDDSVSSSTSSGTDETPHYPRQTPQSANFSQERCPYQQQNTLNNLNRLARDITAYHKSPCRGRAQDSAQTLLHKYGVNISLHTLKAAERIHLLSCIYRRAYDHEASLLPSHQKIKVYPRFFPLWETVDDFDWKYYDHEGNIRPEAYVAMAEATGEEGPFTRKELDRIKMEGFKDARFRMGEGLWKEVEGWVLGLRVEGGGKMGKKEVFP
ncbi:hypothetical protein FKW77_005959 [Venturia effusa]|uniref:Uncharacterized protein n=1 Tax=Venturia effusa TaxID=50376 RepID=A0A517LIV7_9PEZI|nr:hypothetical protein FKW77_005959 [Venturia effusa]